MMPLWYEAAVLWNCRYVAETLYLTRWRCLPEVLRCS
jgi:hypothetical protein